MALIGIDKAYIGQGNGERGVPSWTKQYNGRRASGGPRRQKIEGGIEIGERVEMYFVPLSFSSDGKKDRRIR